MIQLPKEMWALWSEQDEILIQPIDELQSKAYFFCTSESAAQELADTLLAVFGIECKPVKIYPRS